MKELLRVLETLVSFSPFIGLFGMMLSPIFAVACIDRTGAGGLRVTATNPCLFQALAAPVIGTFLTLLVPIAYYMFIGKRGGRSWNTQAPV